MNTQQGVVQDGQEVKLLDGSGNSITSTGGKLDVNATLTNGDIQIGAVELKNATTDDRVAVINTAPTTEFGVVTRNIPSGTQTITGSVTTTSATGSSQHGSNTGLAISASADLVTYTAISGDKLRGFSATSDRAARFRLKINGTTKLAGRADLGSETVINYTPVAIPLTVDDVVVLEVTNESSQGTSSSEASLIIEN